MPLSSDIGKNITGSRRGSHVSTWCLPECRLLYLIKFLMSFLISVEGSVGVTQSKEMLPSSRAVGANGVDIMVAGAFVGPGPGP
jgi:hypothetical protein